MTVQIFGSEATVTYLNCAFFGTAPSYSIFTNQTANAQLRGDTVFANAFGASFSGLSHAALAKLVLGNMGLLPAPLLEQALADYFAAYSTKTLGTNGQVTADSRGFIVLQLATLLANAENTTYDTVAKAWNDKIAASYTYSIDPSHISLASPSTTLGNTYTLTTNVDTLTGGASSDFFDATRPDTLSTFDTLDGGAGIDTLTATLTNDIRGLPASVSIKNIEKMNLNVTGAADVTFTVTAANWQGATDFTVNNANGNIKVVGGSVVNAYSGNTSSTQITDISGSALTTVSVTGGAVTIDNTDAAGTSGGGSTLKAVTLNRLGASATVEGRAISNLTWNEQTTDRTVTISDTTTTALTLNVNGVGYDAADNTVLDWVVLGAATTAVTINATGNKSSIALDGSAATALATVTLTGTAGLNLSSGAIPTSVTSIDGSAATGAITLDTTGLNSTTRISTGSGGDTVTMTASIAGVAISLGAGDDTLSGSATLTSPQIIDGGEGSDTLSIDLLTRTATTALAQFKNFEVIDIGTGSGNLDISQLTNSTITGLTLSSFANNTTISNIPAGVGLTVTGQVGAASTTGTNDLRLSNTSGNTDNFTVSFGGWDSGLICDGASLVLNGVENVTVDSAGSIKENRLSLSDNALQTLKITGDQTFNLTLTSSNGAVPTSAADSVNGVRLLDGSAATGKLTLNASSLNTANIASGGLTIQGGSNDDTLTGTDKSDVIIGNGGADVITGNRGGDKITLSGNTSTLQIIGGDDTGTNNATATQTALLTSNLDIVTGATAGTKITLGAAGTPGTGGVGVFATALTTTATASGNLASALQGVDNAVTMVRGTYDASNGVFSYGANGADTALTYDWNNMVGLGSYHTIILVGYTPSDSAASFALGNATTAATLTLA